MKTRQKKNKIEEDAKMHLFAACFFFFFKIQFRDFRDDLELDFHISTGKRNHQVVLRLWHHSSPGPGCLP